MSSFCSPPQRMYQDRIAEIQRVLREHDAQAGFITALPDVRWATGFTGSNGVLVVLPEAAHFITDGRYTTQAQAEVKNATVHAPGYRLYAYIEEQGFLDGVGTVVFQADQVTVAQLADWRDLFPAVTWRGEQQLLAALVASKKPDEIAAIRLAQAVTEDVFTHVLGLLKPGMTEREVAAEIVYQHLRRGAERMSFEPIVASGPNAALPHARPSARVIEARDVVLIDMGCFVDGYASDMTRTVFVGPPTDEMRKVYQVVLEAQMKALEVAQAGMKSCDLDNAARDVIKAAGYGDSFSHSLGHGVGLQIHEWPRVSYQVEEPLPPGAVVTLEPGIYLPNRFGVRIEDMVVLRENGCENLTAAPKELLVL